MKSSSKQNTNSSKFTFNVEYKKPVYRNTLRLRYAKSEPLFLGGIITNSVDQHNLYAWVRIYAIESPPCAVHGIDASAMNISVCIGSLVPTSLDVW